MTWKELERIAKQHGFRFDKHRRKHDEYYNESNGKRILIERHWSQEIKPGIMKSLLREIKG